MKFSPALEWLIAALLPLTIAWKLAVALRLDNPAEERNAIIEFLIRNQFNVIIVNEIIDEWPVIEARSDECRLLVAKISPRVILLIRFKDSLLCSIEHLSSFAE